MSFDRLVEDFLTAEYVATPTLASSVGIDGYDSLLPDLTSAGYAARAADEDTWFERFRALDETRLSAEEAIDRGLVLATLRGRQLVRDWADWRRNPDTYSTPCLGGVHTLFHHRLHPEPELAASAAARLRAVPDLLDAGRANLDAALASPLLVRRARGEARAGIRYAREHVPPAEADPTARAALAEAGEVAAAAFESWAMWLERFADEAHGDFAIGEPLYSALLVEREGLGYGAAGLRERGQAAYDALAADIRQRTRDIAGHEDWRALLEELNGDHPATPEAMRDAYADWTERAREFCRERDLVTFSPGEECRVEPSPPFQRPVLAVASYRRAPAFRPNVVGTFFVPYPPDGTPPDEVAQRLATNSFSSIPTIAVHEAYPGHHWHLTWAQTVGRPVRQVLGTPYFTEGWALYAEQLLLREGFFTDPRHALCQVDARLFRAARMVVDTSLHMGEMSVDEAVEFMRTRASLSEPTARAEVARYCAWPTQAASYLTGALEIDRLRERWAAEGRGDLKSFHDAVAGSGALPLGLTERALFG